MDTGSPLRTRGTHTQGGAFCPVPSRGWIALASYGVCTCSVQCRTCMHVWTYAQKRAQPHHMAYAHGCAPSFPSIWGSTTSLAGWVGAPDPVSCAPLPAASITQSVTLCQTVDPPSLLLPHQLSRTRLSFPYFPVTYQCYIPSPPTAHGGSWARCRYM